MPNEIADRIIPLYERYAAEWDKDRNTAPWNDRCWIERFASELPPGGTVLDLGCGPGEPIARYLVEARIPCHGRRRVRFDDCDVPSAPTRSGLDRLRYAQGQCRSPF
jgi:hypothetical protein